MREEEPNWFGRWEEGLPAQEELMPLSQTLITPDLAFAFDIPTGTTSPSSSPTPGGRPHPPPPAPAPAPAAPQPSTPQTHLPLPPPTHQGGRGPQQPEYEHPAAELGGGEEPARTLKRPRLVWTPQLHKRFVDAVAHLGIKNAVPKTIMQLMSVDGLTRENVASHLQKYRLYLKRMQGLSPGPVSPADAATEHLFASGPVPHHFLNRGSPAAAPTRGAAGVPVPDQFLPFVPVAALQHHQQMAAAAAAAAHQQQQQYYHHRQMGHMGSPPGGGFDHGYLTRPQQQQQPQPGIQRMVGLGGAGVVPSPLAGPYAEDLDSGAGTEVGRRKVLTLFPTGGD